MQKNGTTKLNLKELKDKFLFIVVGGCDAIGTNFYLYHYAGHWIAVDYGLGFADKLKTPGVEILLPNISFLKNNNIKLDALINLLLHIRTKTILAVFARCTNT